MASHPLLQRDRWQRPHARSHALDTYLSEEERVELESDVRLRDDLEHLLVELRATTPDVDALLFFFRGLDGTLAGFVELCADPLRGFFWHRYQRAAQWCEPAALARERASSPTTP